MCKFQTIPTLRDNLYKTVRKYCKSGSYRTPSKRVKTKFHNLVLEIESKLHLNPFIYLDSKLPEKIKFSQTYKRKDVVRIFSEIGLDVTHYTVKYGRTIVHFRPSSVSKS